MDLPDKDDIMDERTAARMFGVSTRTMYTLRKTRGLPSFTVGAGTKAIRYRRSALIDWAKSQESAPQEATYPDLPSLRTNDKDVKNDY